MPITVEVTGIDALWQRLRDGVASREIEDGVKRAAIRLSNIVKGKLSGPVLNVRTGTLRRSINERIESDDKGITAYVGSFAGYTTPGNKPQEAAGYARIHEFGGTFGVPAHERLTKDQGDRGLKAGFKLIEYVKAHTVTYPERSFLRSSLRENRDMINQEIFRGVKRALKISGGG